MFGWLRNHCNLISLVICLIILSLLSKEFYRIIDLLITFNAPINPVFLCLNKPLNTLLSKPLRIYPCQVSLTSHILQQNWKSSCPFLLEWDIQLTYFLSTFWKLCAVHQQGEFFFVLRHFYSLKGLSYFWQSKGYWLTDYLCGF